jgi:hypothetical protein
VSPPPAHPKIYHITHVDNLAAIISNGALLSDSLMDARGGPTAGIGMSNIKSRRLTLPVACHPGTRVGQYVPFYFCPRSIMLFVIARANHPELTYRGGQGPIMHLEADLHRVVAWAEQAGRPWAFSLANAGAVYTEFRNRVSDLDQLDWVAIAAADFRPPEVKEAKQAEFLVYESFPWTLVERIGVQSRLVQVQVEAAFATAYHRPPVELRPAWYF